MLVLTGIYFWKVTAWSPLISRLNGVILKNYDVEELHETEDACV